MTFEYSFLKNEKKHDYFCYIKEIESNQTFCGKAHCMADDWKYESEYIGYTIASARAEIKAFKYCRYIAKIELSTLNHYLSVINRSKHFSPTHYEVKMLKRQIKQKQDIITGLAKEIEEINKTLKEYMKDKDKLHSKLDKQRSKGKKRK